MLTRDFDVCGILDAPIFPLGAYPSNSTVPPTPAPPQTYTDIDQKDCTDDACTKCTDAGSFKTG